MREFEKETIYKLFELPLIERAASTLFRSQISKIALKRGADLDLRLITTSPDIKQFDTVAGVPAGTVFEAEDTVEFSLRGGGRGTANGVVYHKHNTSMSMRAMGKSTTKAFYSIQSIEFDFKRAVPAAYVIEWVDNLPTHLIWTDHTRKDRVTEFAHTFGSGDAKIEISSSRKSYGGNSALHLKVDGYDFYICRSPTKSNGTGKQGKIVFKGTPSKEVRDKIRNCVSFVLGAPIVYYGVTEYCAAWQATAMQSVSAVSIDGAVFRLHDQPPYPIGSDSSDRIIDSRLANKAINAIYLRYDELNFNELSWSYWYAMCAPPHLAAVYFGGLIEKLQKALPVDKTISRLLGKSALKAVMDAVTAAICELQIGDDEKAIIVNKISNMNQAPQNIILKRTFGFLKLPMSELERDAWQHRNSAAHGTIGNSKDMILNNKVLMLVFHRMIASITECSDRYIDYYNLNFPIRALTDAVPSRD